MAESPATGGAPEPVRVKVYGLFPLTRRRYLWQAAFGGFSLVLVLVLWLAVWPTIEAAREAKPARVAAAR